MQEEVSSLPESLHVGLVALGLAAPDLHVTGVPLTGGISSEIWRADIPDGSVCVKHALERLIVDAEWIVPTNRTAFEADWLRAAGDAVPGAACPVLGFEPDSGVLVLRWLDPAEHRSWKSELAAGRLDHGTAADVGGRLGRIHAAMADPGRFAVRFAAQELFRALRLDPYFGVTAAVHPELAPALGALAERTASTGRTVIHGDVSPKNVLLGPSGAVLLDAECASWGDPAFDLAFCNSHLLLKAVWHRSDAPGLLDLAGALTTAYLGRVDWEPADELGRRAAALVPALCLARVDGASPVEYLDEAVGRPEVRRRATDLLRSPPLQLEELFDRWSTPLPKAATRTTPTHDATCT